MDCENEDHLNGKLSVIYARLYGCMSKSVYASLGCGLGWAPTLPMTPRRRWDGMWGLRRYESAGPLPFLQGGPKKYHLHRQTTTLGWGKGGALFRTPGLWVSEET